MHCGMVSSICGLYLLDKGSIPQSGQSKMSLETALSGEPLLWTKILNILSNINTYKVTYPRAIDCVGK